MSGIVSALSSLASERLVDDKAANLKSYGLDQPAFEVDITDKDNKTHKLLVGDDTPTSGAVYAMLANDPRVFTVSKYVKNNLDKSLNDIRDKRLLTVSADKISRIELVNQTKNQRVEFGRTKDGWQIVKPKPLRADSIQVGDLARKLTDARMDLSDSGGKDLAPEFAHAVPLATVKVTDESNTEELQVRKSAGKEQEKGKDNDKDNAKNTYYAKSSAADGVYKIDADLGQALNKNLDDFRNKKLFDFGFADPSKVELHNGSKLYVLTRNGEDWWLNGKKMDAGSVQSLVSGLRDLSAEKFPDSGFSKPAIEATVTSNDGKQVEKVLIAKGANGYVAQRASEPALYQLTSSSVDALTKAADEIKPAAAPAK